MGLKPNKIDKVFNEAQLPYANMKNFKLFAKIWAVLFRIAWLFGYSNNSKSYSDTKNSAISASKILIQYENKNKNKKVMLIGHGVMNRLILKVLKRRGYIISKRARSNKNFGYIVLQ